MSKSWLACMECGHTTNLLAERKFRCPECGGLYDVEHDYDRIKELPLHAYYRECSRRLADFNHFTLAVESRSGVWAFRDLVMPEFDTGKIITLGERIPIVFAGRNLMKWLGGCKGSLFLALEGTSPTGSFKDFGGTVLATVAKAAGVKAIVCASTGDTSAMAAAYAAAAGLGCAVLLPKGKVSSVQLVQPLAYGAHIIEVPGDFDDCMRIMEALVSDYGVYPANSLNPVRIEGHQATVFNAWQYFGGDLPDWIVAPVGNGSNISSIGKGQRTLYELSLTKRISSLLGCQAEAAAPLARSWQVLNENDQVTEERWRETYAPMSAGETLATAQRIGSPVSHRKVIREIVRSFGAMEMASEAEILEAILVCGSDGHFVCPQTGVALAGLRRALANGTIDKEAKVLVVSTAAGMKFPSVLESVSGLTTQMRTTDVSEAARLILA